jgi:hypothetical protein
MPLNGKMNFASLADVYAFRVGYAQKYRTMKNIDEPQRRHYETENAINDEFAPDTVIGE